jgi:3-hydroxyacyl-CoA dehydrogenase/enoyl-CoA hydratase/3-hydroxybutyryl-CoA epimerase
MSTETKHWRIETDENVIAWLILDVAGAGTNTLSGEVLSELGSILGGIEQEVPAGVVFTSGKPSGFIAGADITEFTEVQNREDALRLITRGQDVFDRVAALPCPTLALINGFCLGGGMELALACDYRIAEQSRSTRLGLPEIKLGIHPGFGGSVRLTHLVEPQVALDLMLTGRTLDPRAAKRIGLIDYAQPERLLRRAAQQTILKAPAKRELGWRGRVLNRRPVRPLLARYIRGQVAKKARKEHYPAPYALIDLWEKHWDNPREMMDAEAESVAELVENDTARNLVRVFLLQDRLKGMGDKKAFTPTHVHVVGGGTMGGDIAAWCALRGFIVTLQDREPKYLTGAMARAAKLFKRRLKDRYAVQAAHDRLIPDHKGLGVPHADLVIEAIFEDADAKRDLYAEIEPRLKEGAILATNTSSIPLEALSEGLAEPGRLVGLHFFNPVAQMPLVEVVRGANTSEDVMAKAGAFTRHIDKLPLPVKSSPGFLVNRILMPYLLEAVELYGEGKAPELIDRAAVEFGMPMGPVELADTVGLDVCKSVAHILGKELGFPVPETLDRLVEQGRLGKKSGRGFYSYRKGKPVKDRKVASGDTAEIQDRLILRLVNEAVACLREEVVADADLVDAGVIFGTGFAPFRGGPLHYADTHGREELVKRLEQYKGSLGERFDADAGWGATAH